MKFYFQGPTGWWRGTPTRRCFTSPCFNENCRIRAEVKAQVPASSPPGRLGSRNPVPQSDRRHYRRPGSHRGPESGGQKQKGQRRRQHSQQVEKKLCRSTIRKRQQVAKRSSATPEASLRTSRRIPFRRGKRLPLSVLQLRRPTAVLRAASDFIPMALHPISTSCSTSASTHNFTSSRLQTASTIQFTRYSNGQRSAYLLRLLTARSHQTKLSGHQQTKDVISHTILSSNVTIVQTRAVK